MQENNKRNPQALNRDASPSHPHCASIRELLLPIAAGLNNKKRLPSPEAVKGKGALA
jgi:hypothetical protein